MHNKPIINSLLDTDLYKFTMLQVILHQFPETHSVYHFKCRNWREVAFPLSEIMDELEEQLDYLCELKFRQDELDYLRKLRFIKSDFVDYLELFQLKRRFIHLSVDKEKRLNIAIEGPMIQAMFFEIFILSLISELYYRKLGVINDTQEGQRRLDEKIAYLHHLEKIQDNDSPFIFSDFGTRRRFSFNWQWHVIDSLNQAVPNLFKGTSNVLMAKTFNIHPIGTMAHEFLQAFQSLNVRLRDFQQAALESWVQEYRGDLGIALTDVVGMDAFLRDFDLYFAKLFDGLRHDSGDPYEWGEKAYEHYQKLRILTKTKMLTFSDGLTIEKAWHLYQRFKDRFKTSFGIGTNLTNDLGYDPLNIVLKLVNCNGQPVAKISDSPGKTMAVDDTFLSYLRSVFEIPEEA
ncbi:nicotinate phosphoribosyltransferase [Neisseriaceae bacterium PsAf]|nr:nicotinate phosphoribosyltransferase [Neisseriaceae bacterium PsAf]